VKRSNKHEAKTGLSPSIHEMRNGEEVHLAPEKRELGYDEGLRYRIARDFDTYVPQEFADYIE